MAKNINKGVLFLGLVVMLLSLSCNKFINEPPINSVTSNTVWISQTNVEQATLGTYSLLRAAIRADAGDNEPLHFVAGDLPSGDLTPEAGNWNSVNVTPAKGNAYNSQSYLAGMLDWSPFYKAIALANVALQNIPNMPLKVFSNVAQRDAYVGEILFLRAYTYFYLSRIWGDPVFVNANFNDVDYGHIPQLARTPQSVAFDSLLIDLKKAEQLLPYNTQGPQGALRANKATVECLMAHIYAWKHDYVNAHLMCKKVLDNGGYSLEPMETYTNIWKGQSSNESIWEIAMQYNQNDAAFATAAANQEPSYWFFGHFLKDSIVNNYTKNSWLSPSGGLVDWFFDYADGRFLQVWKGVSASGANPSNMDPDGYMLLKYTNFAYQNINNTTSPPTIINPYINNNLVLFRLSDIYLLDAEALASTGDIANATIQLSQTENRAGISSYTWPTNSDEFFEELLYERGREFMGEGSYAYDLIRNQDAHKWLEFLGFNSAGGRLLPKNQGYYWPLNMAKLLPYDNLLTQNPWWATH